MATNTVKALRINSVTSDGKKNDQPILCVLRDPRTGEELRHDDGSPAVYIECRTIDKAEHEAVLQEHTRLERAPGGKQLAEFTDARKAEDDLLRRGIVRWHGLIGADDRPLVCTDATKVLLDAFIRNAVMRKLFGLEAAEVAPDTFR